MSREAHTAAPHEHPQPHKTAASDEAAARERRKASLSWRQGLETREEKEQMMKAFIVDRYGSKDGVRAGDMPDPELREDDVLVQIHAAGVNLLDAKIRDGEFKRFLPYRFPLILGNEVAGVVVRVGSRVQRFKPGDEVYARPDDDRIGAFAECIAIQEDAVAKKPKNLTMEEAASIPLVGLTAWQVLVERANLKTGQKVLIHAGSGGVGTVAIQLAKHLGAIVATTTSTANLEWVKRLGADLVIDYRKDDFEHILQDYDVVLNSLGAETLEKSLRVLKPGGKLISISGPPDPEFAKDRGLSWIVRLAMRLLSSRIRNKAKRHHVSYSFLFMRASGEQLREIGSLIDAGIIRPVVDRVFPFAETKEALAYVETGRAKGKVVVKVR
jgi:alcohol dehydrogenase